MMWYGLDHEPLLFFMSLSFHHSGTYLVNPALFCLNSLVLKMGRLRSTIKSDLFLCVHFIGLCFKLNPLCLPSQRQVLVVDTWLTVIVWPCVFLTWPDVVKRIFFPKSGKIINFSLLLCLLVMLSSAVHSFFKRMYQIVVLAASESFCSLCDRWALLFQSNARPLCLSWSLFGLHIEISYEHLLEFGIHTITYQLMPKLLSCLCKWILTASFKIYCGGEQRQNYKTCRCPNTYLMYLRNFKRYKETKEPCLFFFF